jgi:hypothetical protein
MVSLASADVCRNVKFCIDLKVFVMDFFVIPLAGYEMAPIDLMTTLL